MTTRFRSRRTTSTTPWPSRPSKAPSSPPSRRRRARPPIPRTQCPTTPCPITPCPITPPSRRARTRAWPRPPARQEGDAGAGPPDAREQPADTATEKGAAPAEDPDLAAFAEAEASYPGTFGGTFTPAAARGSTVRCVARGDGGDRIPDDPERGERRRGDPDPPRTLRGRGARGRLAAADLRAGARGAARARQPRRDLRDRPARRALLRRAVPRHRARDRGPERQGRVRQHRHVPAEPGAQRGAVAAGGAVRDRLLAARRDHQPRPLGLLGGLRDRRGHVRLRRSHPRRDRIHGVLEARHGRARATP